jgi:hypothetical protein
LMCSERGVDVCCLVVMALAGVKRGGPCVHPR